MHKRVVLVWWDAESVPVPPGVLAMSYYGYTMPTLRVSAKSYEAVFLVENTLLALSIRSNKVHRLQHHDFKMLVLDAETRSSHEI